MKFLLIINNIEGIFLSQNGDVTLTKYILAWRCFHFISFYFIDFILKSILGVKGLCVIPPLTTSIVPQIKIPVISEFLTALRVQQIVGGSKSLFAISQDGKVYACGESTNGRLGLGPITGNVKIPCQLESLSQFVVKKVSAHSGGRHAMAVTLEGKVFSWGEGEDGKLGHGNRM